MFIGHIAVGFAGKAVSTRTPLWVSVLAAGFVDVLWSGFLLTGIEHAVIWPGATRAVPIRFLDYPWSHSLAMTLVWAILFAKIYWVITKNKIGTLWVGAAVLSHWVLDVISHEPDLPLFPGGARLGLGLFNSLGGLMLVELGLMAIGLFLYLRAARPLARRPSILLWAYVGLLLLFYAGSLFGPPAPSVTAVAVSNLLLLPTLIWLVGIDKTS